MVHLQWSPAMRGCWREHEVFLSPLAAYSFDGKCIPPESTPPPSLVPLKDKKCSAGEGYKTASLANKPLIFIKGLRYELHRATGELNRLDVPKYLVMWRLCYCIVVIGSDKKFR